MTRNGPVLAIDAGTTSTRVLLYGNNGALLATSQRDFTQYFPEPGWVEHDAAEIWTKTLACMREVLERAAIHAPDVAAIGIAVQRETVVLWERETGRPIHNAIVWQDRRTAEQCVSLRADTKAVELVRRTGLLLDPYFSATKIAWLLDNVPGARQRAEAGELLAGTIETWLLWNLSGGEVHATDATNASRTLLFDINALEWSDELCELFRVPRCLLAAVRESAADFGSTAPGIFDASVPICALLGDQQAGALGQNCIEPGQAKATFGTGCFVLVNTGTSPVTSRHNLLSTIALQANGITTYALEGSIFNAGSVVQWLRDKLQLITTAGETETIAQSIASTGGVYCIPALTGLGAPWWSAQARAAIVGMTRDTGRAEIIRAALEAVAFQVRDLSAAFAEDGAKISSLRVDGGMAANSWLMQQVADQTRCPVERPADLEATAWGVARLAGMHAGVYPPLHERVAKRGERLFLPVRDRKAVDRSYEGWLASVRAIL